MEAGQKTWVAAHFKSFRKYWQIVHLHKEADLECTTLNRLCPQPCSSSEALLMHRLGKDTKPMQHIC